MHPELDSKGLQAADEVKQLLSSSKLDLSAGPTRGDALQMLALLGMLANDTRQSIAPIMKAGEEEARLKAAPEIPTPAPATAPATIAVPDAPARFDTKRPEYKPALKDDLLVKALLQLSQRRESMRAASRNAAQRRGRTPVQERRATVAPSGPTRFEHAHVPEVPASPKPAPMSARRPGTPTILR